MKSWSALCALSYFVLCPTLVFVLRITTLSYGAISCNVFYCTILHERILFVGVAHQFLSDGFHCKGPVQLIPIGTEEKGEQWQGWE